VRIRSVIHATCIIKVQRMMISLLISLYIVYRRIHLLMILPTAVNNCDMTKKNVLTLGLVNITQSVAGCQVKLFDEITPLVSKSMNRGTES